MHRCALLVFVASCTVNHYYTVAPAEPASTTAAASSEPLAPSAPVVVAASPSPAVIPSVPSSYATKWEPARRYLLAQKEREGKYLINGSFLGNVGAGTDALAPVIEAPDNGFYVGVNRHRGDNQVPYLTRLTASGDVAWEIALPTKASYETYEIHGLEPAPDGDAYVVVYPYRHALPVTAMIMRVDPTGHLRWSVELPHKRGDEGPFVQSARVDSNGTLHLEAVIQLAGTFTVGTGDAARDWTADVSASGSLSNAAIGQLSNGLKDDQVPPRPDPSWDDVYMPYSR